MLGPCDAASGLEAQPSCAARTDSVRCRAKLMKLRLGVGAIDRHAIGKDAALE
jgi:hypothetical protein